MADREQRRMRAEQRLRQLDAQIEDLLVDRALARREIELLSDRRPADRRSRTERILDVLQEVGEASPSQLTAQLRLEEPDVEERTVRATLTHLLKQERVIRPRRGRYRACDASDELAK